MGMEVGVVCELVARGGKEGGSQDKQRHGETAKRPHC